MPHRNDPADLGCGCAPSLSPAALGLAPALGRRELFLGMSAAQSMALAGCTTIAEKHRVASELARDGGSVDLHAHPGMFRSSPHSMEAQVGRSREDVAKVLGGNFRRVFAEVAAR